MSSVTHDDDHQISDVLLSIWECDKVDRRGANVNKERWHCVFCGNEYNIWKSTKALMRLTISDGHSIARCRGEILSNFQRQFKSLKEKKGLLSNQRVPKIYLLQTSVHSDADSI